MTRDQPQQSPHPEDLSLVGFGSESGVSWTLYDGPWPHGPISPAVASMIVINDHSSGSTTGSSVQSPLEKGELATVSQTSFSVARSDRFHALVTRCAREISAGEASGVTLHKTLAVHRSASTGQHWLVLIAPEGELPVNVLLINSEGEHLGDVKFERQER